MSERMDEEIIEAPHKGGGSFFSKFLCVLLGVVIGVGGTIGGVGYAGYYATTQMQIQEGMDLVNKYGGLDIDYTQYLNGSYSQATLMELFGDVGKAINEISSGNGSLNTLNAISPYVSVAIKGDPNTPEDDGLLNELKEYGLELDGDKFMSLIIVRPDGVEKDPNKYLLDYVEESANSLEVPKLLELLKIPMNDMLELICYDEDGPVTVGELLHMDFLAKINTMPLETFLKPTAAAPLMMHLCYGPTHRYNKDVNPVEMNPMYFLIDGDKVFDDMEKAVEGSTISYDSTTETYTLTITEGENVTTYYLKEDDGKYFAYSDTACAEQILFPKTTIGALQGGNLDIINDLALVDVLPDVDPDDPMMKVLCYDDNGKPRTIGSLMKMDFNTIALGSLLNPTDSMMLHLCYGPAHRYTGTGADAVMNQMYFTVKDGKAYDDMGKAVENSSISYDLTTETYTLTITEGENVTTYYLKEDDGKYIAFSDTACQEKVLFPKTTIGSLQGNGLKGIIGSMAVKDLLPDANTEDPIMKALCEDENGNPRTVDDLMNMDFNTLALGTLLKPTDSTMLHLCYGPAHRYTGAGADAVMNQMYFTVEDGKAYDDMGKAVENSSISYDSTTETYTLTITEGEETTIYYLKKDGEKYIAFSDTACQEKVLFPKTTIGSLQEDGLDGVIGSMTLVSLLPDVDWTDPIMKSLGYDENGKERTVSDLNTLNFDDIALGSLLKPTDAMMLHLCYGPAHRYTGTGADAVMNQMYFFIDVDKVFDDMNQAVEGGAITYDSATETYTLTITEGEETTIYYLKKDGDKYYAYSDTACEEQVLFPKTTIGVLKNDGLQGIINTMTLVDLLPGVDWTDPMMKSFGYDENGNPRTVGYLQTNGLNDIINDMEVKSLLSDADTSNPLMHTLCYNDDNTPRTVRDLQDMNFNTIALSSILTPSDDMTMHLCYGPAHRYTKATSSDGATIVTMKHMYYSVKYEDGTYKAYDDLDKAVQNSKVTYDDVANTYTLTITEGEDVTTYYLKENDGLYYAYSDTACTEQVLFPKTTIGSLQSGGLESTINTMTLQGVLHVTKGENNLMDAICFDGERARTIDELDNELLNSLTLIEVLGDSATSNKLMNAICYDQEGNARKINELSDPSFIDDIPLSDVLHVDEDSSPLVAFLVYGKEGVHYQESTTADGDIIIEMQQKCVAIYGTYVFDEYGHKQIGTLDTSNNTFVMDGVTYQVAGKKTSEPTTIWVQVPDSTDPTKHTEHTAEYYYICDMSGNPLTFETPTLGDLTAEGSPLLSSAMDHLTVYDILGDSMDESSLLHHIGHVPIGDMNDAVAELKIVDLFETDVYYYDDVQKKYTDAAGNVLADQENHLDEHIRPTWKYLLTNPDTGIPDKELTVTTGMSIMMSNMTANIQNATLRELVEDGILTLQGAALDRYNADTDKNDPMFELTLPEAIEKMFELMAIAESYPDLFN